MKQYVVFQAGDFVTPSSALGDDTLSPFLRLLPPVIHIWLLVAHNMLKGGLVTLKRLSTKGGLRAHAGHGVPTHTWPGISERKWCVITLQTSEIILEQMRLRTVLISLLLHIWSDGDWRLSYNMFSCVVKLFFQCGLKLKLPMHSITMSHVFQQSI